MRLSWLILVAFLGGCSTLLPVTSTDWDRPITSSCADTPDTRKQIIQHNSALDTIRKGKPVVYRDRCPAKTS